jgi:hypothetical protein
MRLFTFLTALLFLSLTAFAQNVLTYNFNNTLEEADGQGPELTVLGNQGVFMEDTLLEIGSSEKWVYRFEKNSGLQFVDDGFLGDSYTIELYFVFDELNGWKRVVDWKNRKTDYGAYVYYGQLNFYPYEYSGEAPVLPEEYTYYVITRDGATGELLFYCDADVEISFTDDGGDALVDGDNVVNFFHDDLIVPNEASSGAVAMLRMYNYALDSNAIKQNFENLGSNVFSVREIEKRFVELDVYPNPASSMATIYFKAFDNDRKVNVMIQDMLGHTVRNFTLNPQMDPALKLDVSSLPKGIYMIKAESVTKSSVAKLIVR